MSGAVGRARLWALVTLLVWINVALGSHQCLPDTPECPVGVGGNGKGCSMSGFCGIIFWGVS